MSFIIFGIALLLPYNALMAAMDYFIARYPDHSPAFSFLLSNSLPMLLVQILVFKFITKIPLQVRVTLSFFINAVITILLGVLPVAIENQTLSFYIEIGLTFIFGSVIAFL